MTNEAAEIEVTLKQAQECITAAEALDRLHKNRDFKRIFVEGYFKEEPVRLVGLKADPNMQSPERQEAIVKDMDAIGSLQVHFRTIYQRAAWAEQAIAQGEQELVELAEESIN